MVTRAQARRARRRLDDRLAGLPPVEVFAPPPVGWIRAIREALGMTLADLGARMGSSGVAVLSAERNEAAGTIRLGTLRRAAEALDCTLVYAFIPNSSLVGTLERQAERVLERESAAAERSMELESQPSSLLPSARRAIVDRLVDSGQLWRSR